MSWKLFYIKDFIEHPDSPVFNAHRGREIVREEFTNYPKGLDELLKAFRHLDYFFENGCRIIPVQQSAQEFLQSLSFLQNDNYDGLLEVDRRYRAYCVEFDVFLDYWYKYISHYKRLDKKESQDLVEEY